jgi:glycosyltransferase involved in cell wall biosynthesis
MRVGLDATPLLGRRTGVGNYVAGLLRGFAELAAPEVVLAAFTWRGVDGLPEEYARARRRFSARALQAAWVRSDWPPVEALCGPVDVFHGTNFVLPPTRRAGGVVTIHDLAYVEHADTVAPATLRYRALVPRALRRGAVVVTATETVADRIRDGYRLAADRVVVAPLGVGPEWFAPPPPRPPWLPSEYLLFVGNLEPRKNVPVLLDALARLRRERRDVPPLVLVGPPAWGPALDRAGLPEEAVLTAGYVGGDELVATVAAASLLVLPSRDEGFGLPPLEALATGTPVVVSDLPVLREVLGGQAAYAPVGDAAALADALGNALDAGDGGRGARAGRRAYAAAFNWTRCALATTAAYERARP